MKKLVNIDGNEIKSTTDLEFIQLVNKIAGENSDSPNVTTVLEAELYIKEFCPDMSII